MIVDHHFCLPFNVWVYGFSNRKRSRESKGKCKHKKWGKMHFIGKKVGQVAGTASPAKAGAGCLSGLAGLTAER